MNKVITINLNGVAYQLEEGGFDALRAYLDHAARRLEGNPDKDEIITDIEQAIADKFRALLGAHKTVVNTKEVTGVIAEMGPVEGDATEDAAKATPGTGRTPEAAGGAGRGEASGAASYAPRRLYKIPEGAMLAGVCNGASFQKSACLSTFSAVVNRPCAASGESAAAFVSHKINLDTRWGYFSRKRKAM